MNLHQPQCIWELNAELGEGPIWLENQRAVYLVDIKGRKIHCCAEDGSERQFWRAPDQIGFVLPMQDGDFVCGLPGRLERFSPRTGQFTLLRELETDLPGNRLNDGYVDRHGVLWFGSMDDGETAPSGSLYRLDGAGNLLRKDDAYVITNGPVMSPCGKTFYHTDTLQKVVYAFDVSADGQLSGRRRFIEITGKGHPDGTAVDADGYLWISIFGGARIERYSPAGELAEVIAFPCSNITKLAFGGADLRTAFVSTAWKGLSSEERSRQPLAGGLFTFRVATPGLPQYRFQHQFSTGAAT